MPRYIAFLRAINAGPGRVVKMDALRRIFEALGLTHIETFVGTGNVVFESRARNVRALERRIGARLHVELGYNADALIRTPAELETIARYKPFGSINPQDGLQFNIIFLANVPSAQFAKAVKACRDDWHRLRLRGRELYWLRRQHSETGNFAGLSMLKTLDVPYTMRGARTVVAMAAKYGANEKVLDSPKRSMAK